jgi:hypothetical protein
VIRLATSRIFSAQILGFSAPKLEPLEIMVVPAAGYEGFFCVGIWQSLKITDMMCVVLNVLWLRNVFD